MREQAEDHFARNDRNAWDRCRWVWRRRPGGYHGRLRYHRGDRGRRRGPAEHGGGLLRRGESFEGDTRLYIEHNATDKDTGVHGMFDQEGLAEACLQMPDGTQIMLVDPTNQLGELGINQFFFESREPPNSEYSIADLKADFPEGDYRISGVDFEGNRRTATADLTHDIPAPPKIVAPKLVDEEKADQNEVPASGTTVRWRPVTETLDGKPTEIAGYQVTVTDEEYTNPNALSQPEYDVHVGPDVRRLDVPDDFLSLTSSTSWRSSPSRKAATRPFPSGFSPLADHDSARRAAILTQWVALPLGRNRPFCPNPR